MNTLQFPFEILTIAEVGEQVRLKDTDAIRRWCLSNDVPVYKLTSKDCVYRLDLQFAISKSFILKLQKVNPFNWKEVLEDITPDVSMYNFFLLKLGEPRNGMAFTNVEPTNEKEQKLLKSILS